MVKPLDLDIDEEHVPSVLVQRKKSLVSQSSICDTTAVPQKINENSVDDLVRLSHNHIISIFLQNISRKCLLLPFETMHFRNLKIQLQQLLLPSKSLCRLEDPENHSRRQGGEALCFQPNVRNLLGQTCSLSPLLNYQ